MGRRLDTAVSVLNGLVGQHLAQTDNGLATPMEFFRDGVQVPLTPEGLRVAYPEGGKRIVVLVHGLMCTEAIWEFPDGSDYGSRLARDAGLTPLWLRYNTGKAIADNGAEFSIQLTRLLEAWPEPLDELVMLGYSMGGLVIRSAAHVAEQKSLRWLEKVKRAVYVGTPHLGAPMERIGKVITSVLGAIDDPYTRLIAQIADFRSDGFKDLGHADLRHQDRGLRSRQHPVPLLPSIRHHVIAGSLSKDPRLGALFGDALVPVPSGTAGVVEHVKVIPEINHLDLAHSEQVYAQLKEWIAP